MNESIGIDLGFDYRLGQHDAAALNAKVMRVCLRLWGIDERAAAAWLADLPTLDGRVSWEIAREPEAGQADLMIHLVKPSRPASGAFCWNGVGANEAIRRGSAAGTPQIALFSGKASRLPAFRSGCWISAGVRPMEHALGMLAHALVIPQILRDDAGTRARQCLSPLRVLTDADSSCLLIYHRAPSSAALHQQIDALMADARRFAVTQPLAVTISELRNVQDAGSATHSGREPWEAMTVAHSLAFTGRSGAHAFIVLAFPWLAAGLNG